MTQELRVGDRVLYGDGPGTITAVHQDGTVSVRWSGFNEDRTHRAADMTLAWRPRGAA